AVGEFQFVSGWPGPDSADGSAVVGEEFQESLRCEGFPGRGRVDGESEFVSRLAGFHYRVGADEGSPISIHDADRALVVDERCGAWDGSERSVRDAVQQLGERSAGFGSQSNHRDVLEV